MGSKREYGSGGLDQLPSGKWRGRVRTPDGRRVTVTRDTEEACKKELRRLAGKVAGGEAAASTKYTVRTWLETWLAEIEGEVAPRTLDSYSGHVRLHIVPEIGSVRLSGLRPEHVVKVQKSVADKGLSPATAVRVRATLRRSLNVAVR